VKAGITLLGALLALALPATARAQDTYTVHYCQAPGGGVGSVDGFSAISGAAGLGFACPAAGVSSGPPTSQFGTLEAFGIRYRVPADTRLASFVLWRTVAVPPPWNYTLFADSDAPTVENSVETCWTVGGGPCRGVGDGRISNASRIARTTPDTGGLLLWVDCNPGPCPAGGSTRATVHRLDAELSDRLDPVLVGTPSGDLLDSQRAVAGTRSIAFSASDRGGGIYRAAIEVDGAAAVSQVVDDNGGRCREPFTAPVPCRLTASGSIALDTATLADGVHSVRLVVSDATGTNAVAYGPVEITTRNQAPGCDPAVTRATTPVTARFRGTRRPRLTRARGRARVPDRPRDPPRRARPRSGPRADGRRRLLPAARAARPVAAPARRLPRPLDRPAARLLAAAAPEHARAADAARAPALRRRRRPRAALRPAARREGPGARQDGRAAGVRARPLAHVPDRAGPPRPPLRRPLPLLQQRRRAHVPDARAGAAGRALPVLHGPLARRARARPLGGSF
jgi:hypothetical protein